LLQGKPLGGGKRAFDGRAAPAVDPGRSRPAVRLSSAL